MQNLNGKRIALIGGAGFIGHNMAMKLKDLGAEVMILDGLEVNNLLSFTAKGSDNFNAKLYTYFVQQRLELLAKYDVPVFIQDARDYHKTSKLLNEFNANVVVHLAAVSHADRSNKDPHSTFDHSFRTLENALDYAKDNAEHFISFSSSMVYGHFKDGFVTEDSVCNPLGIYGALKYGGEKLVIAYNQVFNLPYTIIRPSALYGQRCVSRRVGQIFIENALQGKKLTVHGDGSDRLDFTYIDDFVDGMMRVIGNPNSHNQVFNLTNGGSQPISEMLVQLSKHFPEIDIEYVPKDRLMPDRGTLSIEKANKLIGYQPQNPLGVGYEKYIEWYKEVYSHITGTPTFFFMPQVESIKSAA